MNKRIEKFIPRGANYVFVPQGNGYDKFILQVGIYDPQRTRDDFAKLAGLGYNTIPAFFSISAAVVGVTSAMMTMFGSTRLTLITSRT